jgi:hypothetical protein
MIEITSLQVRSYELDFLDLFWELNEQSSERIEEYDFFVLRSIDGPAGPFRQIAGPFYNTYNFRDGDVQRLHQWRKYFYKVKWTHRATGREKEAGPVKLEAPADRIAMDIRRRELLLLRKFTGRIVFLYPRLTFGNRCPNCFDVGPRGNSIARSTIDGCQTCFGTSFLGGYANPIAIWAQIDPSPDESQRTDLKEHQFRATTGRTTFFPPIKDKDVIVEAEDVRWFVKRVSYTEKGRAKIRQELVLHEVLNDDVRHSIPVNADLLKEHRDSQSMRRPMSLQFDELEPVRDMLP